MAIVIRCNACGKQYNADDSMAGRRVKCRQCGNVMVVMRQAGDDDAGVDLEALAKLEQSFAGHEGGGFGPVRTEPVLQRQAGTEGYDVHGERASAGRPNYRFTFPLAKQIDQWSPVVLVVGCIAA